MNKVVATVLKEATLAVLPVVVIILLVNIFFIDIPGIYISSFLMGSLSIIVGMALFNVGSSLALIPIGQKVGSRLIKTRKILLILCLSFLIGIIITIAEPDLIVLAEQIDFMPKFLFVFIVSTGVGFFLSLAIARMLYKIKINYLLIGLYGLIMILMLFSSNYFTSLAFDASGVTTGPISVPLILALGLGFTTLRGDKEAKEDSFGIISLCSVGPIIIVLLLGLFFKSGGVNQESYDLISNSVGIAFIKTFFNYSKSILLVLLPISLFFLVFQSLFLKLPKNKLMKIIKGLLYTYIGLVLFLTGANMGYMPLGYVMGNSLARLNSWIIIPISFLMGCALVITEPPVKILTEQIDKLTHGNISKRIMMISLSLSVAASVVLAVLRIIFDFSILYILLGGYLSIIIMALFVPKVFTSIAFDSGGVAAGTMSVTFLLPFTVGISEGLYGAGGGDAFGMIALTALAPIFTIQIIGVLYKLKSYKVNKKSIITDHEAIVDYQEEEYDGE